MKEIVAFLVDNWQLILTALLAFVSFILALIRKKPVLRGFIDYCRLVVTTCMPDYIIDAEQSGMSGSRKREYVLAKCMAVIKKWIQLDDSAAEDAYNYFADSLEKILSTPRKKD